VNKEQLGMKNDNTPNREGFFTCWPCIGKRIFPTAVAIFLVAAAAVCVLGLAGSIHSFVSNQRIFTQMYRETTSAIQEDIKKQELSNTQDATNHLERLQAFQRSAASHDVMAFLYSTLSGILVALCFFYARTCKKQSEKAEKKVESAFLAAEDLYNKKLTEISEKMVGIDVQSIHIEIIHARSALLQHDQSNTNDRLSRLPHMVDKLKQGIDPDIISNLIDEIRQIHPEVSSYYEYANSLPDEGARVSAFTAIDYYRIWIDDAIGKCAGLLPQESSAN
jgi:hypothetical protein